MKQGGPLDFLHGDWDEYAREILNPLWKTCVEIDEEEAREIMMKLYGKLFPIRYRRGITVVWRKKTGSPVQTMLPAAPYKGLVNWFKENPKKLEKQKLVLATLGLTLDMLRFIQTRRES